MRRVRIALTGALLLALTAAGCLEFDKQTIYFEHDQDKDRLIMVINYGGLYAETKRGADLAEAQRQLDDAVKDHSAAFVDNWPFVWSSVGIREQMADPEQRKDMAPSEREKVKRLTDLVTVLNAGFYTDAAGRVCGAQVVVVEHVSEAVDLINGIINEAIVEDAAKQQDEQDEFAHLAIGAARVGHKWVELDGDSLIVRVPMTEDLLEKGWKEWVDELGTGEAEITASSLVELRQLLSTPMFIWYQDGMLSFKVGLPSRPFSLNSRPRQGDYQPNMVDYIKEKYGFDLDARIARYLVTPDAPADEEPDRAAKLMAPRLTTEQRAGVLVSQLQTAPSDALWALLRKEPTPEEAGGNTEKASKEEVLKPWQDWLTKQAAGPDTEKEKPKAGDTDSDG